MPLKVNVGITKKLGLPNYGSAGASCHLEFELDTGQILHDPAGLHRKLESAYDACRQAVQEELGRQLSPVPPPPVTGESDAAAHQPAKEVTIGTVNGAPPAPAPNMATTTPATCGLIQVSPLASQRQLNYVHHLAHGISGLSPRRLEILAATICGSGWSRLPGRWRPT